MPASRTISPIFSSEPRAANAGVPGAAGGFGPVAAMAAGVLEGAGVVIVVGPEGAAAPEVSARLTSALEAQPGAAFAFGDRRGCPNEGPPARHARSAVVIDAAALIARPFDIGPLAIRVSEAARLGWPDFGPPDHVLDGAATWALAAALAARGGSGLFVPGAWFTRAGAGPGPIERLAPEGVAWLVACALSWGPGGRPSPDLAERLWRRWTQEMAGAGFRGLTPRGVGGR